MSAAGGVAGRFALAGVEVGVLGRALRMAATMLGMSSLVNDCPMLSFGRRRRIPRCC